MRTTALLLLVTIISLSAAGLTAARKEPAADWLPIRDVKDPHVQAIAKYAVKEHNKEDNVYLKLVVVLSGKIKLAVDGGINYKLIITADDGPVTQGYEAIVWEKDSHSRQLTSFRPLHEP